MQKASYLIIIGTWILLLILSLLNFFNFLTFIPLTQSLLYFLLLLGAIVVGLISLFFHHPSALSGQAFNFDAFNAIDEGILILDHTQTIVYTNPTAVESLHTTEEEILNKSCKTALPLFNEEGDSIYLGTGKNPFEEVIDSKSGQILKNMQIYEGEQTLYFNLSLSPLQFKSDEVNVFILLQDISEEQALEKMKLDFVAMAAHELRTPMTSIRGYLDILIDEADEKMVPEHAMLLQHALMSSDRLVNLMNNLLSISQIERHKIEPVIEPTDIGRIVTEAVQAFKPEAENKKLKLELIKPKVEIPMVAADPKLITQVIDNLIQNAISYTAEGGVSIRLAYQPGEVIVAVRDTGQGIPIEALPHMFQKFYRVSSMLEQGSKGTGLGLYIAKKIIEMHNGRIWVESVENKGTTFYFSLREITKAHG